MIPPGVLHLCCVMVTMYDDDDDDDDDDDADDDGDGDAATEVQTIICSVTKLCDDCTIYNLSFLLPSHVSSYYFCWHTAAVVAFVAVAAVVSSAVSDIDRYRLSTTRYIIRFVFLSETNKSRLGRARKSFGMARPPIIVE